MGTACTAGTAHQCLNKSCICVGETDGAMSRVFPKSAMLEAEQLTLPEMLWQRPQVYGITIDGETSRDLDDAIWLEPTPTGATVWVHIADVSTVIRPGTSLDQAAIARTQTDYHRQGTAPMFPRCLSEHLLSLLGQQRRPTLTVEIQLDPTAQILDTQVFESWIATDRQLSYAVADAILADPTHGDWPLLQNCQLWAERIYRRRLADSLANAVDLPEGSWLDENGLVIDSDLTRYHSHLIIQEFMIIANTAIAQWLDQRKIPALYRNHTPKELVPSVEEIEAAVGGSALELAEQRRQIACALNRAEYAADRQGHFALNLEAYCHFTSPIRRLADLINHRLVKAWIHQRPYPYNREKLRELAAHINQMAVAREEVTKTFFKARHHRLYQTQLQTPDLWETLSQRDFSRLLRYAVETEQFTPLFPEVQPRLQRAELTLEDCFVLFFLNQDPELRQQVLDRLTHSPHDAASIIAIADNQLENCQGFRYIEVNQGIYFAAWLEVDLVHGLLTTAQPAISTRKAHARHCACVDWLQGFMADILVHPSIRLDPDWPSPPPMGVREQPVGNVDEDPDERALGQNAIGVLNELAQQLGVSPPIYVFVPVADGFCCQVHLDLLTEQLTGQGVAINKRVAKCLAAEQVLVALEVAQYVAWELETV